MSLAVCLSLFPIPWLSPYGVNHNPEVWMCASPICQEQALETLQTVHLLELSLFINLKFSAKLAVLE